MEVRRRVAETGLEQFIDVRAAAARDDDATEPPLPPGPGTAWIPTSDQRPGPE